MVPLQTQRYQKRQTEQAHNDVNPTGTRSVHQLPKSQDQQSKIARATSLHPQKSPQKTRAIGSFA